MTFKKLPPLACAALAISPAALAQDSVAIGGPIPGDAVSPYATNEQSNRYTVDLQTLTSGWGNEYLIGPISKSSLTSSLFANSLMGASGISREILTNVGLAGTWGEITVASVGVNDDPSKNVAAPQVPASVATGVQFASGFGEFGTTDGGADYNGVVTNIVNYDPANPSRLYVNRVNAATNGCSETGDLGTAFMGGVEAGGGVFIRSDDFGIGGTGCTVPVSGNNIFFVNSAARDTTKVNALSGDILTSGDFIATAETVKGSGTTFNVPSTLVIGGVPYLAGSNFNNEFVAKPGLLGGPAPGTGAHLGAGIGSQRGNVSVTEKAFPLIGATEGVGAVIGDNGSGTNTMSVFGIGAGGAVTGTLSLTLPGVVTDNLTGFNNLAGANEIDHYHSQVAFQGGNGQIALNVDHAGNLLAAVVVDHPADGGPDYAVHYIAVARVNGTTGAVDWTMAAYQDGLGSGKPYTDGAGTVLGNLSELGLVTGGAPLGPSSSAPMIDSFGNIYFFGAALDLGPSGFDTGLFRAVYDPATFSYELEQLFKVGRVLDSGLDAGGSKVPYQIQFVSLADSNSISSTAPWSQNISEDGAGGQTHLGLPGADTIHLGGLVLSADITYDGDLDGDFETDTLIDPATLDQSYQVQLYIGSPTACQLDLGVGQGPPVGGFGVNAGDANLTVCGTGLGLGESSTVRVTNLAAFAPTFITLANPLAPDLPVGPVTVINGLGIAGGFPLGFNADATGTVSVPVGGTSAVVDFTIQAFGVDLLVDGFLEASNAVLARFGQ